MGKPQIEVHEYYDFLPVLDWMTKNVIGFDKDVFWSWACELPGFSNDTFFTFLDDETHPMAKMLFEQFGHSFYICW